MKKIIKNYKTIYQTHKQIQIFIIQI